MNELDFYRNQVSIWGIDYVEDLVERGYAPKLTEHGYRWIHMPDGDAFLNRESRLDSGGNVCYPGRVGA